MKQYLLNVLIGFDDWLNTLRGGPPDTTISASAALARSEGRWWGCQLCRVLDWMQTDHCNQALVHDALRAVQAQQTLETQAQVAKDLAAITPKDQ